MVIKILRKPAEIMLDNEFMKELRIARLHSHIPGQPDRREQEHPWQPERLQDEAQFANCSSVENNHERGEKRRDGPLRQHPQGHAAIKDGQVNLLSAVSPRPPAEHSKNERRSQ